MIAKTGGLLLDFSLAPLQPLIKWPQLSYRKRALIVLSSENDGAYFSMLGFIIPRKHPLSMHILTYVIDKWYINMSKEDGEY